MGFVCAGSLLSLMVGPVVGTPALLVAVVLLVPMIRARAAYPPGSRGTSEMRCEELEQIIDAIPDQIMLKNIDGTVLHLNRAWGTAAEVDHRSTIGHNERELMREDDLVHAQSLARNAARLGAPIHDIKTQTDPKAGSHKILQVSVIPVQTGHSGTKMITIRRDITEATETNRKLVEAEERLDLAMRTAKVGLWSWDLVTEEIDIGDSFSEMLGYLPGELELLPESRAELCHPDDLAELRERLEPCLIGGSRTFLHEHRVRRKSGDWLWVRNIGHVMSHDGHGHATKMIGAYIDIDSTRRMGHALERLVELRPSLGEQGFFREMSRILSEEFGFMFAGVSRTRGQSTEGEAELVGAWNSGAPMQNMSYRIEGTPCAQAIQDTYCFVPSGVQGLFPEDETLVEMGAQSYAGVRLTDSKSNQIGVLMIAHDAPIHDDEHIKSVLRLFGTFAAAQLERLDIEQGLRLARDAAEDSNRSKSNFLATMSHEIRTPMTAILGYTDLLLDPETDDAGLIEYTRTIQRNGQHLLTIINDILDLSKIESGKMAVERIAMDPVALVHEVIDLVRPGAEAKSLKLDLVLEGPIPERIESDPTRVRQILLNIVGNAVKFTSTGSIGLSVCAHPERSELEFRITDTGIGMSAEQCDRISRFEEYTQADGSTARRFGGSGLGLRISNELACLLGGSIEIASTEGEGSTFTVTIDMGDFRALATEAQRAAPERPAASDTPGGKPLEGTRILVADDGVDNQRLIKHYLERAGAEVDLVYNGHEVLELLDNPGTISPPHLILMDMEMPVMDGFNTMNAIRLSRRAIPIIALTAHSMPEDRERCFRAGCDEYIAKPIDRARLLTVCKRLIEQARFLYDAA